MLLIWLGIFLIFGSALYATINILQSWDSFDFSFKKHMVAVIGGIFGWAFLFIGIVLVVS